MGPLVPQRLAGAVRHNDPIQSAGLGPPDFRLQLGDPQLGVPMNHVDPPIVIKKQGGIVKESAHLQPLPWPGGVFGLVQQRFAGVVAGKRQIKDPVAETQGRRPHALPVDLLPALQAVGRAVLQPVEDMAYKLPVDQIPGAENVPAGHEVHGGAGHVVGVSHPDDVRVREVGVDDRIGILISHRRSSVKEARLEIPAPW